MARSETRARIGVAEALAGLHVWILPNAFKSPKKHHDDEGLLPDFSSPQSCCSPRSSRRSQVVHYRTCRGGLGRPPRMREAPWVIEALSLSTPPERPRVWSWEGCWEGPGPDVRGPDPQRLDPTAARGGGPETSTKNTSEA